MAAKRGEGVSSGPRGRRNKRKGFTYKTYIWKVLRDVDNRTGINAKAMTIMNNFMEDMFGRIAAEAARLSIYNGKRTLTAREIQTAVRLVLPGELGKFASCEGAKAVTKFSTSRS